jgi:hypothetical protein
LSTTSKPGRRCPWVRVSQITTSTKSSQTWQALLLFQLALLQRSTSLGLGSLYAETPHLGKQLPQIVAALCVIFTQIPYTNSVHKFRTQKPVHKTGTQKSTYPYTNPYTKAVHKSVHKSGTQIRTQNRYTKKINWISLLKLLRCLRPLPHFFTRLSTPYGTFLCTTAPALRSWPAASRRWPRVAARGL